MFYVISLIFSIISFGVSCFICGSTFLSHKNSSHDDENDDDLR